MDYSATGRFSLAVTTSGQRQKAGQINGGGDKLWSEIGGRSGFQCRDRLRLGTKAGRVTGAERRWEEMYCRPISSSWFIRSVCPLVLGWTWVDLENKLSLAPRKLQNSLSTKGNVCNQGWQGMCRGWRSPQGRQLEVLVAGGATSTKLRMSSWRMSSKHWRGLCWAPRWQE